MAGQKSSALSKKIARRVGRFFSTPRHLLIALITYIVLCLLLYAAILVTHSLDYERAAFITYDIATGGDPNNFTLELAHSRLTWTGALFIHVLSWLAVPILIAMVVDAAYKEYEDEKLRAEKRVEKRMRQVGGEKLLLAGEALKQFVEEQMDKMRRGE